MSRAQINMDKAIAKILQKRMEKVCLQLKREKTCLHQGMVIKFNKIFNLRKNRVKQSRPG